VNGERATSLVSPFFHLRSPLTAAAHRLLRRGGCGNLFAIAYLLESTMALERDRQTRVGGNASRRSAIEYQIRQTGNGTLNASTP
jgi:hypothetical protein